MGVKRAVELVLDAPKHTDQPIYTYGPLIHNPQVLDLLREKGITVIEQIPETGNGVVLIRAHGVPPVEKKALKKAGFSVKDATCPRVIKVQSIILKHARKGYSCIIIGDKDHPEVKGLLGFAGDNGLVIKSLEEMQALPMFTNAILVAQTTLNSLLFRQITEWVKINLPHYRIFSTICDSTSMRQTEVGCLARTADALIVVGGKNSGNTQRLAEIARLAGIPTYAIESESELNPANFESVGTVAITAGASTPNWIINRVVRTLEKFSLKRGAGLKKALFTLQRTFLLTNLYVALGAGSLCLAASRIQEIDRWGPFVGIAILYVLSMHILNNLTGKPADRYNDPERERFYDRYRFPLTILALASGGAGLLVSLSMGWMPFLMLLVMSLLGLSYNMKLVSPGLFRYTRLRDIPGSKTILIALAWGMVTSLLPALSMGEKVAAWSAGVFFWTSGLAFARAAFFDVLDMQGDRIVGKETIPLILGETGTFRLLNVLLLVEAALALLAAAAGKIDVWYAGLAVCPLLLLIMIHFHRRGDILPGVRLEFLVESAVIPAGFFGFFGPSIL